MPQIIDPDDLSQGLSNAVSDLVITTPGSGAESTITSAAIEMGSLVAGDFFEIRDHSDPLANGLWKIVTVNTDAASYEADKVSNGAAPATAGSEAATFLGDDAAIGNYKNVYLDTLTEEVWLLEQGNLDTAGVIMLAVHSFIKEEWKTDQLLIDSGAFPMVGISFAAGQWEFGEDPSGNNSDWKLKVDAPAIVDSVRLIRNAGFDEKDNAGVTQKKFFNVSTLGAFEDTLDQAFYFFGNDFALDNTVNYAFTGVVNEPVQYYELIGDLTGDTPIFATTSTIGRSTGDFIADGFVVGGQVEVTNSSSNDGTYVITAVSATVVTVAGTPLTVEAWGTSTIAYDNSNAFTTSLRIRDGDAKGKSFQTSTLTDAGETAISSKIIKFPLANAADQKIDATDANVVTSPWTEVRLRYMDETYNRAVDSATLRSWGVIVDVGTFSQANGVSVGTTLITSANFVLGAGEALADYTGGTITMHDATAPDRATHTIVGTPVDNAGTLEITVSSALTNSETSLSFTIDRAVPITPSVQNIYEKIQYQLRQTTDIDESDGTVIGKMTGGLANYVGDNITFGGAESINPNGGGAGVIVEGFDANDTNNMFFVDNTGAAAGTRNFPFVAAGNLNFNSNLTGDSDPEYFLYYKYTNRTTNADIDTVTPSGDTFKLTGTLPNMTVNDYIRISGFVDPANNGLFIVTVETTPSSDYDVRRVDGTDVGIAETDQTVNIDENPYNSPDAILVDNNAGADIVGAASAASVAFDYDYDNNSQGGRTPGTDAECVLKAIGLETGQYVEVVTGLTISRITGLSFTATSPLERNYSNP